MSARKELVFFLKEYPTTTWHKGLDWYKSHWPVETKVRGETSPQYTHAREWRHVPPLIKEIIPDAKILYITRDPIKMMISNWRNLYRKREISGTPLGELIMSPDFTETRFYQQALFYTQATHYLRYFDESQVLLLVLEEMQADPRSVLREVFTFLDIDPDFWDDTFAQKYNQTQGKRRDTELAHRMKQFKKHSVLAPLALPQPVRDLYKRWLKKPVAPPELLPEQRDVVWELLGTEIENFRRLTGKKLEMWSL